MKHIQLLLIAFGVLAIAGCKKNSITLPPENDETNLANTKPLSADTMRKMEGIYKLSGGSQELGIQFVCKVSRFRVSFFSEKEGIFIILKHGYRASDGSIQFSGFWRYSEKKEQGNIQFSVSAADGATALRAGLANTLKLQGSFDGNSIVLEFDRAFSAQALSKNFMIIAHHGVQTTSDPPYAENSLDGVLNDENYGVTGLEYDIRMTKDNVPICMHDPSINTRIAQKGPLSGKWDEYPYQLINNYIRLIDGQKVPSVEQVLNAFIDSTYLTYLWLDIKGNPDIFKYLEPLVRNAYARAAAQNRNVVIIAGLPSEDVITEFKKQPSYANLPTLCEQSLDLAIENGSKFYGPRFSEGLLLDEVEEAHNKGIKVISWTLNSKKLIQHYLVNGKFDGFITDYPAYVVYSIYTML
jgi:glycerophosphoryl diester phosphodiesterase